MQNYFFAFIFILGGFLLGILFEKIILRNVKKVALKTKWEGDELILSALEHWIIFWFVLAGIYVGLAILHIPTGIFHVLGKIISILYILSATLVLAKITINSIMLFTKKHTGIFPSTSIFTNLAQILVILIGVLIILNSLGISITPILTALGVGGLAVALALQETLSNFFAGLHILMARQVKPGDYVRLGSGEEGYVTDISGRNTTIRELSNNLIIIPNVKFVQSIVKNFVLPQKEMSVVIQMGVDYRSDLEKVEQVTIEVAREVMKEVKGGVPKFEPFIRYHTFGDFAIQFSVILRCKEYTDQYLIKHEFIKRLHRRYQKEGIEIPFPIRRILMNPKGGQP